MAVPFDLESHLGHVVHCTVYSKHKKLTQFLWHTLSLNRFFILRRYSSAVTKYEAVICIILCGIISVVCMSR